MIHALISCLFQSKLSSQTKRITTPLVYQHVHTILPTFPHSVREMCVYYTCVYIL